jgi:hypothetical protein
MDTQLDTASPKQVAEKLFMSEAALAQLRFRGRGPRFCKVGRRVLYRWSDVNAYLEANAATQTGERRLSVA